MRPTLLLVLLLATSSIVSGQAVSVPGLFNTGVDDAGAPLPAGSPEIHYTMAGPLSGSIAIDRNVEWAVAPRGSGWIGPTSAGASDPVGVYVFSLVFNLTGLEPTDTTISGRWATDNAGAIFLNGVNTGIEWTEYAVIGSFTLDNGFVHGMNLLEIHLTNWPGQHLNPTGLLVTDLSGTSQQAVFPTFCDGSDGALASCPCSNAGNPDTGCDLPGGSGGVRLDITTQQTSPHNRTTAVGTGYLATTTPTALVIRANGLDIASPVIFGDGLRCVGHPLVRLSAATGSSGVSQHTFGHGTAAGSGTFYYQLWFRSEPASFCTPSAFNLSSGRTITW